MRVRALFGLLVWTFCATRGTAAPVPVPTLGEAKLLADGTQVRLEHKVASSAAGDLLAAAPSYSQGVATGNVASSAMNEISGIAASVQNADVLWAHNDSGDSARVFAINTSGTLLATYSLSGASAFDWEDMELAGSPGSWKLYLADIGDNFSIRSTINVYRVPEPDVSSNQSPVVGTLTGVSKITLKYEDGPRDAEAFMVDGEGDFFIVTKREAQSRVYRATAADIAGGGTVTLHLVTTLPFTITDGGDISKLDGSIILRNYSAAYILRHIAGQTTSEAFHNHPFQVPLRAEPQGEAIAFAPDGESYFTTSEGLNQPVYHYAFQAPVSTEWYLEEPGRAAGLRCVGAAEATRGQAGDAEGVLSTTAAGERMLTVQSWTPDRTPATPLTPLATRSGDCGGADFGTPPLGQAGTGGAGLNNVGLLARVSGKVTSVDYMRGVFTLADGASSALLVDLTGLKQTITVGAWVHVTGIVSLRIESGNRVALLRPRDSLDVSTVE